MLNTPKVDMTGWRSKAHRIIHTLCGVSYKQANTRPNGKPYKRHRPYAVPHTAEQLVNCLNRDDEETAKAIFIRLAYAKEVLIDPLKNEV